ncbi:MAG: pyruvate, phosphate dikinase, partial [Desulfosarcinaceae bacterium]
MIKSRALEVNLARTQVDVAIDPRYACLQEVMSRYFGLMEGLNTFLKEISHPYKNWQFIVDGARGYALDYFHMMKRHPRGPEAVERLVDLFRLALASDSPQALKIDAADNLILYLQKIVKTAEQDFPLFAGLVEKTFDAMAAQPQDTFTLFVRSFYPLKRLAWDLADCQRHCISDYSGINRLLIRALEATYAYWLEAKDPLAWFSAEAELSRPPAALKKIFQPVTHEVLGKALKKVTALSRQAEPGSRDTLGELLQLPHHSDIVQAYRRLPQQLLEA